MRTKGTLAKAMMETSLRDIGLRLQCGDPRCQRQKWSDNGVIFRHCPAHDDKNPSLSLKHGDDKVLWKCQCKGCSQEEVTKALKEKGIIGASSENGHGNPGLLHKGVVTPRNGNTGDKVTNSPSSAIGLSTAALAASKSLSLDLLRQWGVGDSRYQGVTRVAIPYMDVDGNTLAVRYRLSLGTGGPRFMWRRGDHVTLYGWNKLAAIHEHGWVLLVEGESDTWTGWQHNVPVMGIPGKTRRRSEWAEHLGGLDVYLSVEPEADDLVARVGADVPGLMAVYAPDGIKDLSEAHLQGLDVAQKVEALKVDAVPAQDVMRLQADQHAAELQDRARSVLASPDPLEVAKDAIRASGYGGDLGNALVVYLAATSRLLAMSPGTMPVHLLLLGPASAGKSYTLKVILRLLPGEAKHEIDAGSPRTLIYDDTSFNSYMTQAQEIINTLNGLGVNIHAQGDKLVIVPKSKVPSDLVAELHQHNVMRPKSWTPG